jgi:hypothetical protein
MIWYGVSNKKHYLNAQVHFPVYFPTSDGKIGPIPSFFDGPRKAIFNQGKGIRIHVQGGARFFLGGNQQRKQNTSQKKHGFCVCLFLLVFFVHVVFSICFQRLFLILCIFSLNYYTK